VGVSVGGEVVRVGVGTPASAGVSVGRTGVGVGAAPGFDEGAVSDLGDGMLADGFAGAGKGIPVV
jgi:hypothetical protein